MHPRVIALYLLFAVPSLAKHLRPKERTWQVSAKEEVQEFMGVATALVVNVGTLSQDWIEPMHLASETANRLGKPWILDPVGAGATHFRNQVNQHNSRS